MGNKSKRYPFRLAAALFAALFALSLFLCAAPQAAADVEYTDGAWGTNASTSNGSNSYVIGSEATAYGNYSYAIGTGTTVYMSASYSYAIGYGASVTASNAIALGSYAVADTPYTISVGGGVGQNYRIVNMAAGQNNNDAVNVSQLKSLGELVASALGGDNTKYEWSSGTGTLTTSLTVGGTGYSSVQAALTALENTIENSSGTGSTSWTISDAGGTNTAEISDGTVKFVAGSDNVEVTVVEDSQNTGNATVTVDLADEISVDKLTVAENTIISDSGIAVNGTNSGVTISNSSITVGDSSGVTITSNKITNLAAGTADTDAVNVGQLNDAIKEAVI